MEDPAEVIIDRTMNDYYKDKKSWKWTMKPGNYMIILLSKRSTFVWIREVILYIIDKLHI